MNAKNILTTVITSVIVVFLGFSIWGGKTVEKVTERVIDRPVNVGSTGQTESFRKFFSQGAAFGGSISTTTTAATYTLVQRDLDNATVVSWLPNVNTTISLSSTSTLALIPNTGDVATIYFRNASTTQAASITFAAVDAGLDLQTASSTGAATGDLVLKGLDWAQLTFIHTTQNLVTVFYDEFTEAD